MTDEDLTLAANWLRVAKRVCVLTGAGVSAESGVPTFRAADGMWEGHHIEDVASPEGFERDRKLVWAFYNARRANVRTVKPNPGHEALAIFEKHWGSGFTLITQNVDGLHRVAGNQNILELHGSLRRTRCLSCDEIADRGLEPLSALPECPDCGGDLRPDIVWFGEALPEHVWDASMMAAMASDVMLVVGTSAVVNPAASLIPIAIRGEPGAKVIEVNLTETEASRHADIGLYGPSGQILPRIVEKLGI